MLTLERPGKVADFWQSDDMLAGAEAAYCRWLKQDEAKKIADVLQKA